MKANKYELSCITIYTLLIGFLGIWYGSEYEILYGSEKMWLSYTAFVLVTICYFIIIWSIGLKQDGTD